MALLDDLFKGNPLTGIAIGFGAYLLAPTIGPALRPAAKAVIKAGILAYHQSGQHVHDAMRLLPEPESRGDSKSADQQVEQAPRSKP